jgi:hypothetical protein
MLLCEMTGRRFTTTERDEHVAELTCYDDLHSLIRTDELTTDRNRKEVYYVT